MDALRAQSIQAGFGSGLARQPSSDSVSSLSSACSLDKQEKKKKKGWVSDYYYNLLLKLIYVVFQVILTDYHSCCSYYDIYFWNYKTPILRTEMNCIASILSYFSKLLFLYFLLHSR